VVGIAVLPMFPLQTVLLPGGVLPLHVFEPRYRQLVVDCLADDAGDPEFGVALIERGSEVGGGDQRATVGVVAQMVQVEALADGRYAVVAVGTRRIRVNAWLPDDPYPLADVDEWRDLDPDAPGLRARVAAATSRLREVLDLAARFGEVPHDLQISDDPLVASYHLAGLAPLGPADRYRLLCAESPSERLELLAGCLDDVEAMIRFRLASNDDEPC
jgi:Lon protease-like protein